MVKDKAEGEMFNLQNKFPNLNTFSISSGGFDNQDIEIIENPNCKVNNIYINNLSNTKIDCQTYNKLTSLSISLMKIANYKNIFPFNINNNRITFKSLITFNFYCFNNLNIDEEFLKII